MKRLEIVLMGHSLTLTALNTELQDHGHGVRHLSDQQALEALTRPDGCGLSDDVSGDPTRAQRIALGHFTHRSLRSGIRTVLA
ncbi:hypothetical protein EWW49_27695, partial [Pseudomonas syringae]